LFSFLRSFSNAFALLWSVSVSRFSMALTAFSSFTAISYEDKVMERITERNFEMMSGKYQKEQLEIEARLKFF